MKLKGSKLAADWEWCFSSGVVTLGLVVVRQVVCPDPWLDFKFRPFISGSPVTRFMPPSQAAVSTLYRQWTYKWVNIAGLPLQACRLLDFFWIGYSSAINLNRSWIADQLFMTSRILKGCIFFLGGGG